MTKVLLIWIKKINTLSSEHIGLLNINGIQRRHSGSNSILLCLFAITLAICSSKTFLLREIINLKKAKTPNLHFQSIKATLWFRKKIKIYYEQLNIYLLLYHWPFTINKVSHVKSYTLLNWTSYIIHFLFCLLSRLINLFFIIKI